MKINPKDIPNIPEGYCPHITTVYKMHKKYHVVSKLQPKDDAAPVAEVDVPEELPVVHYIIVPKEASLDKDKVVENFDQIKDVFKNADCIYGQDLRGYKDQLMMSLSRLPLFNAKWIRQNLTFTTGAFGIGLFSAAVFGFFAFRNRLSSVMEERVSDVLNRSPNGQ